MQIGGSHRCRSYEKVFVAEMEHTEQGPNRAADKFEGAFIDSFTVRRFSYEVCNDNTHLVLDCPFEIRDNGYVKEEMLTCICSFQGSAGVCGCTSCFDGKAEAVEPVQWKIVKLGGGKCKGHNTEHMGIKLLPGSVTSIFHY